MALRARRVVKKGNDVQNARSGGTKMSVLLPRHKRNARCYVGTRAARARAPMRTCAEPCEYVMVCTVAAYAVYGVTTAGAMKTAPARMSLRQTQANHTQPSMSVDPNVKIRRTAPRDDGRMRYVTDRSLCCANLPDVRARGCHARQGRNYKKTGCSRTQHRATAHAARCRAKQASALCGGAASVAMRVRVRFVRYGSATVLPCRAKRSVCVQPRNKIAQTRCATRARTMPRALMSRKTPHRVIIRVPRCCQIV